MRNINKKGAMALSQILILIIGVVAIAYAVGSSVPLTSAGDDGNSSSIETEETPSAAIPKQIDDKDAAPEVSKWTYFYDEDGDGEIDGYKDVSDTDGDGDVDDKDALSTFSKINNLASGTNNIINLYERLSGKRFSLNFDKNEISNKGDMSNANKKAVDKFIEEEITPKAKGIDRNSLTGWQKFKDFLGTQHNSVLGEGKFTIGEMAGAAATSLAMWQAYSLLFKAVSNERNQQAITNDGRTWIESIVVAEGLVILAGMGPVLAGVFAATLIVGIKTAINYQVFSQDIIEYQVSVWQPQYGGSHCEECNELEYGCSEYQCHTYGKSCEIINDDSDYDRCVWVDRTDLTPPVMSVLEEILSEGLEYWDLTVDDTAPDKRGTRIVDDSEDDKCVEPFSDFTFGIQTDEYAYCKWDYEQKESMDEMAYYLDEGNYATINHTMYIPNTATASTESLAEVGIAIEDGRDYNFYIMCADDNGNENPINFAVSFCVEDGPDTDAPIIKDTSYGNEAYIPYNTSNVNLEVYTNEPATCKWDFEDVDYDQMDNNMTDCSRTINDYLNGRVGIYGCKTNLTGLQNYVSNEFYIRCQDKPAWEEGDEGEQFANEGSFLLTLTGTYGLYIEDITIGEKENGSLIKSAGEEISAILSVKTAAGADEGKSLCTYGTEGATPYAFKNDGSKEYQYENTQKLFFKEGDYTYSVTCIDKAGNKANGNISFEIQTDKDAPTVVRAFQDSSYLKIITSEESSCVYSNDGCDYYFEDGLPMTTSNDIEHYTSWDIENTYYIKCKDEYGNLPDNSNDCNIIVRPFEL